MTIRFAVQGTDHGYGVWDAALNGWRSQTNLTKADADAQAANLNTQEQAQAIPKAHGRRQDPPKRCQVYFDGRWWSAHLTEWQQSSDGSWWGLGTCDKREWTQWVPAAWLRPR